MSGEPSASTRLAWLASTPDYVMHKTARSIIGWTEDGTLMRRFTQTSVPTLYVYGENNADKALRLPTNIARAAISDTGHFMMLERPAETFQVIKEFLTQI